MGVSTYCHDGVSRTELPGLSTRVLRGLSVTRLNRDEERRLREIERSLKREDPEFAQRIIRFGNHGLAVWANGAVAVGLLSGSAVSGLGVLLAVVGLVLRLAAVALDGLPPADDEGHGSK